MPLRAQATRFCLPVLEVTESRVNLSALTTIPLVGAQHPHCLTEVDRLWAAVQRECRAQVITISGHGGIGKSRLVAEWIERTMRASNQSIYLLCPSQPTHYGVVTMLLRQLLDPQLRDQSQASDPLDQRQAVAAQLLAAGEPEGSQSFYMVMLLLGLGDLALPNRAEELARVHRRLGRTLARLLTASVTSVAVGSVSQVLIPQVLIVDDAHLLDDHSATLLRYLTEEMTADPCLFLLAHHPSWKLDAPRTQMYAYPLDLLAPSEATEYVRHYLSPATDAEVVAAIAGWIPANPLALEQIIVVLRQRQILVEQDGAWRLTRSLDQSELPTTIRGIILERLRLLPPPLRIMLQEMAVLGTVGQDLLMAMLGQTRDEVAIDDGLYELERSEFVREDRVRGEVRFIYDVIAREIYQTLSAARRRDYHWRALEVWSLRSEDDPRRIQA